MYPFMSFLAIDIGNTRLKWAYFNQSRPGAQLLAHGVEFLEQIENLADNAWKNLPPPTLMLGCAVAGEAVKRRAEEQLELWPDLYPRWVVSRPQQAGLVNGYDIPSRLGADRWVAMIGARQHMLHATAGTAPRPFVLVMIGTAVTVEAVDAHGKFLGGIILPALIGTFRAAHPEVTVSVRISGSHEIARKVLAGEYDLGLVGAMWNERGLDWTELFTDTLVLVARPDHPLAGRGPVTLDDLCGQDYVGREPGSGTRKVIGALLEAAGRRETDLRRVALFGGNEAVREAVKAGVGVSMLSRRSVAADLAAGALVEIPLQGVSGERPFYLLRRRNRQLPPSAAALAEHLLAAATRDAGSSPA